MGTACCRSSKEQKSYSNIHFRTCYCVKENSREPQNTFSSTILLTWKGKIQGNLFLCLHRDNPPAHFIYTPLGLQYKGLIQVQQPWQIAGAHARGSRTQFLVLALTVTEYLFLEFSLLFIIFSLIYHLPHTALSTVQIHSHGPPCPSTTLLCTYSNSEEPAEEQVCSLHQNLETGFTALHRLLSFIVKTGGGNKQQE